MKKAIIILLISFAFSLTCSASKADTIDWYWIYYNDTVWAKMNQNMNGYQLKLDTKKINNNDHITISYGTDTRCLDCRDSIMIEDDKQHVFLKIGGRDGASITISVNEMVKISNTRQIKDLYFYYVSNLPRRRLLFKLKLD